MNQNASAGWILSYLETEGHGFDPVQLCVLREAFSPVGALYNPIEEKNTQISLIADKDTGAAFDALHGIANQSITPENIEKSPALQREILTYTLQSLGNDNAALKESLFGKIGQIEGLTLWSIYQDVLIHNSQSYRNSALKEARTSILAVGTLGAIVSGMGMLHDLDVQVTRTVPDVRAEIQDGKIVSYQESHIQTVGPDLTQDEINKIDGCNVSFPQGVRWDKPLITGGISVPKEFCNVANNAPEIPLVISHGVPEQSINYTNLTHLPTTFNAPLIGVVAVTAVTCAFISKFILNSNKKTDLSYENISSDLKNMASSAVLEQMTDFENG